MAVQHLAALGLTSESLFSALDGLFEWMPLPWDNLVSILIDSCSGMRGSKSGLEKKFDIGDSCHHLHNARQKLCSTFESWVEDLLSAYLESAFHVLSAEFHTGSSVLDVSLETLRMWDALVMFYFAFLDRKNKSTYEDNVNAILQNGGCTRSRQELNKRVVEGVG